VKVIDLHGIRHKDVYGLLEKPCVDDDIPFIVITGKSDTMKKIVTQIVATFGLHTKEKLGNSGRLIVCESR
tara:strand:- start:1091 stop:1303 length:213 start_codon:yes stop_codon:yes gene_type:complete